MVLNFHANSLPVKHFTWRPPSLIYFLSTKMALKATSQVHSRTAAPSLIRDAVVFIVRHKAKLHSDVRFGRKRGTVVNRSGISCFICGVVRVRCIADWNARCVPAVTFVRMTFISKSFALNVIVHQAVDVRRFRNLSFLRARFAYLT